MDKLKFPSSREAAEDHLTRENYGRRRGLRAGDSIPMSAFAGTALAKVFDTGEPVINNCVEDEEEGAEK